MAKKPPAKATKIPKDRLLPKVTLFFFDRVWLTAILWVVLVVFGAMSYTTLLKREGFPSVNIPVAVVQGTYFVNDAKRVDSEVAKPLTDAALKLSSVKTIQTSSAANFLFARIQYKEGTDASAASKELESTINQAKVLPSTAQVHFQVPYFGATGGDTIPIDVAVSFYSSSNDASLNDITAKAQDAVQYLKDKHLAHVQEVTLKNPYTTATDPATGQQATVQRTFDRYGNRKDSSTNFHDSVIIAISKKPGSDVIKLDEEVHQALNDMQKQPQFQGYQTAVSASFAPNIEENISELQRVLLEGLIAVLVIGSIVIAIRASLITVVSMVTVVLLTLGLLYVFGYSLNVITLFALILGLALVVDDTIIMVEAVDAARMHNADRRKVISEATRKISRAMVAATLTACVSFMPLLFVSGVLGSFIRAIPVTIISSLIISLFVALIFIPFMARFLLLTKKQMGKHAGKEVAASFESRLAAFIAGPMLWARNSKRRLFGVGLIAIFIGFGFIMAGLFIAKDVAFNIFPPTKDTNGLVLSVNFAPGKTIDQANEIAAKIDTVVARELAGNFEQSSYYASGNAQSASEQIQIISYNKREITSPQLVTQIQTVVDKEITDAKVTVGQLDVGPPSAPFQIKITAENREAAYTLAKDVSTYMEHVELKRINGTTAHFTKVNVSSPDEYLREGDRPVVIVSGSFDATDTSTLTTLAQDAVKKEFTPEKVSSYGLPSDALTFDIGQESENQDSFKTLALAFPVLLFVIFLLLAVEFRSLLQPLLIFMAIPFSIFGVMLGLRLTHNAISFFTMLGFFALIGLSIKNTILLTDYANQARRNGSSAIDSAVEALEERFRPLFATSVTAVFSLIPLALSSPFWQGLSVVLIFGLLSSTFLVVTVFPYYYLGAEYLRIHISAKHFFMWLIPTVILTVFAAMLLSPAAGALVAGAAILVIPLQRFYVRVLAR